MAIASPSTSSIAATLSYTHYDSPRLGRMLSLPGLRSVPGRLPPRLTVSSRFYSSKPSSGSVFPEDHFELHYSFPPHSRSTKAAPVFVTLPPDAVNLVGQMKRKKAMGASFMALMAAGVEGIVVEVWWGIVEREGPRVYDWGGYLDIVDLAGRYGLKVRAVMAFHQCGRGPDDSPW